MTKMPKKPTKRGTEHGPVGRRPSSAHRSVARWHDVECRCGYVGPLDDVQWWKLVARFCGECPECGNSLTFRVPLSEVFGR